MRVLLTGASGFIGRHCLPLLLEKGYEVHAVRSKPQVSETHRQIVWHEADLLDDARVSKVMSEVHPTHLLHFAWYTVPVKYWTSLENFRWVRASLQLVDSFVAHGGQRAVIAGSCAEYDWHQGYCSEFTTPREPQTVYGTCKHSLQEMLSVFSTQTGLSSAWGRIFFLYGPYENPEKLVSSVVASLLAGKMAKCSHGNQLRDFLQVGKAAAAFVSLLESSVQGPVNIASGRPIRLRELVEKIGEKIGRRDLIRFGELSTPPDDPPLLLADVRRLRDEVKWSDADDLDQGLDLTISWWKKQLQQS